MKKILDTAYHWNGKGDGNGGHPFSCQLRIFEFECRKVVTLSAITGSNLSNSIEHLATAIAARYELNPVSTIYLEHYPPDESIGCRDLISVVNFSWHSNQAKNPQWDFIGNMLDFPPEITQVITEIESAPSAGLTQILTLVEQVTNVLSDRASIVQILKLFAQEIKSYLKERDELGVISFDAYKAPEDSEYTVSWRGTQKGFQALYQFMQVNLHQVQESYFVDEDDIEYRIGFTPSTYEPEKLFVNPDTAPQAWKQAHKEARAHFGLTNDDGE